MFHANHNLYDQLTFLKLIDMMFTQSKVKTL